MTAQGHLTQKGLLLLATSCWRLNRRGPGGVAPRVRFPMGFLAGKLPVARGEARNREVLGWPGIGARPQEPPRASTFGSYPPLRSALAPAVRGPARPRGVVLIVVLALLALLALVGLSFALLAGGEEVAARQYHQAARPDRPQLSPEELILYAVGQLVADTDNPLSALRGHSLLRDMYGNDNDLYDELGRPIPNRRVDPSEYYQRAFNGPGEKGADGAPGTPDDVEVNYVYNGRIPEIGGGFDEDYDYPDHQNMFLAAVSWEDAGGTIQPKVLVPSFHRPWMLQIGRPRLWCTLRATGDDRPFEVDNDEDGVPDSVWVDLGFPVQRTADGRKFKPLFAFLVLDLDSRLNLNVHGQVNADKIDADGKWVFPNVGDGSDDSHADYWPKPPTGSPVGLGRGVSVTEVNLQNVFSPAFFPEVYDGFFSPREYQWLLEGRLITGPGGQRWVGGRWGEEWLWPVLQPANPRPRAGVTSNEVMQADDDLGMGVFPSGVGDYALGRLYRPYFDGARNQYDQRVVSPSWFLFRTPFDFDGDGALWVDEEGRVLFGPLGGWQQFQRWGSGGRSLDWPLEWGETQPLENIDEADEINVYTLGPSPRSGDDAPFTLEELEALYRYHGLDGRNLVVNSRLPLLAASLFDERDPMRALVARRRRSLLTTESWDLITYSAHPLIHNPEGFWGEGHGPGPRPANWPKLFGNGRLLTTSAEASFPGITEWGSGPVGNKGSLAPGLQWTVGYDGAPGRAGVDDDGDGIVDDEDELGSPDTDDAALPMELAQGRRLNLWRHLKMPPADRKGPPYWAQPVQSYNDPRALARDIYLALRLIRPTNDLDAVRRMAQFAVNVVDFIDPDDVMTPFEYDWDLRDGWNVDGNPGTVEAGRELVWGCEKPRLVINETLAYEVKDDQFELWFELYNPELEPARDINGSVDLAEYPAGPDHPLRQKIPVYQVMLVRVDDSVTGEPTPGAVVGTLVFEPVPPGATGGKTLVNGGEYLVVGPKDPPLPAPQEGQPRQVDFDTGPNPFGISDADAGDADNRPPGRRLFLRRLAHPGHPHDPGPDGQDNTRDDLNPYITVDCLEVRVWRRKAVEPEDPEKDRRVFASVERVEAYSVRHDEHSQDGNNIAPHTLGARNEKSFPVHTALTFHDRPLATPLELMLVPATHAPWLTTLFTLTSEAGRFATSSNSDLTPYDPGAAEQQLPEPLVTGDWNSLKLEQPYLSWGAGPNADYLFGHLWNFFREVTPPQAFPTPGYYRLFELVEVPSLLNGSRDVHLSADGDNRVIRVPGKININTITEPEVFLALLNNHPAVLSADRQGTLLSKPIQSLLWQAYASSRNGRDGVPFTQDDVPFRTFLMGSTTFQSKTVARIPPSIHWTLLRAVDVPDPRLPLFQDPRRIAPPGLEGRVESMYSYPAFLWQPLFKLGNVVTVRSCVFAVWLTVGFFEVEAEPVPDGMDNDGDGRADEPDELLPRLGGEIGQATGQVVRHRAFFVVDRSRAKGWAGPPQTREQLLQTLADVVVYSRILE
jgi:hypothetical protein